LDLESPVKADEQRFILTKEEKLFMEAGIFKNIDIPKNDPHKKHLELKCIKCGNLAHLIELKTNVPYCKNHGVERVI
jgi:hypothetical protein